MLKKYKFIDYKSVSKKLLAKLISALPDERKSKALNYRHDYDKISCAVSYLLLVYSLKNDFKMCDPIISVKENGKPYLSNMPDVHFNISHCRYGCAVAVSNHEVGIDIQDICPVSDNIINRVCCQNEINIIQNSSDRSRAFAKIWAMKESYVKMLGYGILCELDKINTTQLSDKICVTENEKYFIAVTASEV